MVKKLMDVFLLNVVQDKIHQLVLGPKVLDYNELIKHQFELMYLIEQKKNKFSFLCSKLNLENKDTKPF